MNLGLPTAQSAERLLPWLLAGLCVAALIGASWITADIPRLRPDTAGYLYFDPSRPIGYPAFLWIVDLFGKPQLAAKIQMLILAISLFLLGWAFYKWSGRPVLAALFQLALLASPEMWKFSAALNVEALATSGVALWCAQLLVIVRKPSLKGIGFLAMIAVASTLVKPSLVMMFGATAVTVLLLKAARQRLFALALTSAGLIAALGVTPIANYFLHGSTSGGSPVARGILQHTLFCPMPSPPTNGDSAFVERQAKPVRDYISGAPEGTQGMLKRIYTGKLRFGLIIPTLGRRHGLEASWQTDELVWNVANERVSANPGCYIGSVVGSYLTLATYKSYSAGEVARLEKLFRTRPPVEIPVVPLLPRDEQLVKRAANEMGAPVPRRPGRRDFEPPTGRPILLIWAARIAYGTTAIVGLAALVGIFRRSKWGPELGRVVICAAAMGVLFHGLLGLTSLIELHLTRYTVPLWPVVCSLLGMTGYLLTNRFMPAMSTITNRTRRAWGRRVTIPPQSA